MRVTSSGSQCGRLLSVARLPRVPGNPPARWRICLPHISKMKPILPIRSLFIFLSAVFCAAPLGGQDKPTEQPNTGSSCFRAQNREESKQLENKAIASLPDTDHFWLTEDVAYIISPEERCVFLHLGVEEEREQFIEQFWLRRAPDPKSLNYGFKQEHYRRIAFSNQK